MPRPSGRGSKSGPSGRMEWIIETVRRYNYRAYPTRGQREALSRLFGACRYAWNWYVRQRLTDWNFNRSRPSYAELNAKFNRTKTEKALEWLTQVSAVPLAQSLRQCEKAYSAFFRYVEKHGCHVDHKGRPLGYPRFKSRHCGEQSATFTTSARFHVRHDHDARWMFLDLPKIDGEIRLRWSRDLPSRPSSVTVMRHADGTYEASFVVKTEPKPAPKPRHNACGIDMGLESLVSIVHPDGTREKVAPLRALRKAERRLGKLDKELSRRKRGSNDYSKTRQAKGDCMPVSGRNAGTWRTNWPPGWRARTKPSPWRRCASRGSCAPRWAKAWPMPHGRCSPIASTRSAPNGAARPSTSTGGARAARSARNADTGTARSRSTCASGSAPTAGLFSTVTTTPH